MASPVTIAGQEVIYADARNMSDVKDNSVDLFITSPPYWNLKDYGSNPNEIGDSNYHQYIDDLTLVWRECFKKGRNGSVLLINVNSRRSKGKLYAIAFDIVARMKDWTFWDQNIWYIPNALPQPNAYMERLLDNKYETLLVFVKGDASSYTFHKPRVPQKYIKADPRTEKKNSRGRCLGNILRIPAYRPPNIRKMNYHVAAYPEELVAFFVASYTNEGDTVLDPFLGSGTTLKVCRVMKRKGMGFEIHSEYAPLIESRINEAWAVPDWRSMDIIHSTTNDTGAIHPRKSQYSRRIEGKTSQMMFDN